MWRSTNSANVSNWALKTTLVDNVWRTNFNTIFGDQVVASKNDKISIKFNLWILPTEVWTTASWTGASVTEVNSKLYLQSWTDTNGTCSAYSLERMRYHPWHDIYVYFTYAWLDWWVEWATQYVWAYDDNDWYFIWYDWTTFKAVRREWWNDYARTQAQFDRDTLDWNWPSWFTIDWTKINIFRLNFGYLGVASCIFEVFAWPHIWWIAFNSTDTENALQDLAIENPNLPIKIEITKTSWTTNITWYSGSWNAWYYNGWISFVWNIPHQWDSWNWITLTWTWVENVVIFHIKDTFNGKPNYVASSLLRSSFNSTASSDILKVQIIANPTSVWWTAVASLTYTDVNTTTSTLEYSNNWWVIVWWTVIFTEYLIWWGWWSWAFAWTSELNAQALWLRGRAWDYFAIAYTRVSWSWAYNALAALQWTEEF